jgi:hypothetical protein
MLIILSKYIYIPTYKFSIGRVAPLCSDEISTSRMLSVTAHEMKK